MTWKRYVITLAALVLFTAGCLSGPLPEDLPNTPAPLTPPPPSLDSLKFISFDEINISPPPEEISGLVPEIDGLVNVPYTNPVDVVSNDLSVLNHPRRLPLLASIVSKYTTVYVEPQQNTGTLVYFTVYNANDTGTATELLEAYKSVWNKRSFNSSGLQIWIWDGYIDEMAGSARPLSKDSIVYWNPEAAVGFLSEQVLVDHPALTKTKDTLYSVHGEMVYGTYFIMIDVKTERENIKVRTEQILSQAVQSIMEHGPLEINVSESPPVNDTNTTTSNASSELDNKINLIKEDLRSMLDSFLAVNITKDEYDKQFEQLNAELQNLTNST